VKKNKLIKKIRRLEKRINKLENQTGPEIKQIGFHYLANMDEENEFEDEGY